MQESKNKVIRHFECWMGIFEIFSSGRMPAANTRVSPRDRPKLSNLSS